MFRCDGINITLVSVGPADPPLEGIVMESEISLRVEHAFLAVLLDRL